VLDGRVQELACDPATLRRPVDDEADDRPDIRVLVLRPYWGERSSAA
jgi:hypothetical protein